MAQQQDWASIYSKVLQRSIDISIYDSNPSKKEKPIVYLTDGRKLLENGVMDSIKRLTLFGQIPFATYVFVSTVDRVSGQDYRNENFFCNPSYIRFFESELVPFVEKGHEKGKSSFERSLVGISFGGLNAAYFSARTDLFGNYALLSPVIYPCKKVISDISFSQNKSLRIILTTGKNDAENYVDELERIYGSKGYELSTIETNGQHDFNNWNAQWRYVLNFLISFD
ncbi:alpha/beta hydrolase [Flagellimonas allohymeniacidonis]|nr:alpha/beta hydrolase-fold protein [Allomuricauda hymeniacidonis]